MADINNFVEISENFDTIKTLLNSIRAQGILNTSDVDKLLSGINAKLERINTEEDIDLIKIFLSELKNNLEERHGVLVSKFGAIESLFSSLLKNSSEMPKSNEIKELFDIVATNLSVFSREVVSQKETLTDITLRLDAIRSDDTNKKDIIKNIALLKPDLERLNNGFDSIVISLNDNFKTIIKTITSLDKTDSFDKFSDSLNSIEMSTNTLLSALQVIDKKADQVDNLIKNLPTKEDLTSTNRKIVEISANNQEISMTLNNLSDSYSKLDTLADKIDASVSIIASLKSVLEEADNKSTIMLLEQIRGLESELKEINSDSKFEEFKVSLENLLKNLSESVFGVDKGLNAAFSEIQKIIPYIEALDLNVKFQNLTQNLKNLEMGVKTSIDDSTQKILTLQDANITRLLNEISSSADSVGSKINQTQSALSNLCEKNFNSVFERVVDLKNVLSQIDENSVSANNAIFSSITDRLTLFENSLKNSLDSQEQAVSHASAQLVEQIDNIKNLSSVIDYKMDSSVVEVGNVKREFSTLKSAVEDMLALDFVTTVKDLRVDLYASKQEMVNAFESSSADLTEKFTSDLYSKYELLISKLDAVEEEFKSSQLTAFNSIKSNLENISASIVDVISYVSESKTTNFETLDSKIAGLSDILQENSMNYVESVRDVVDVIRIQVENNLKTLDGISAERFDLVKKSISESSEDLKKELKYSYSKLLEIQDSYNEIKELININNLSATNKIDNIVVTTENAKNDFEANILALKSALLEKISEFKQEFTCENADKVSELKFSVENLYNKNGQEVASILENLNAQLQKLEADATNSKSVTLAKILENFVNIKDLLNVLNENSINFAKETASSIKSDIKDVENKILDNADSSEKSLESKTNKISEAISAIKEFLVGSEANITKNENANKEIVLSNIEEVKTSIENSKLILSEKSAESIELILANFVSTKELLNSLNNKTADTISEKVVSIIDDIDKVKTLIETFDENVDSDMTRQLSIIESNFESLVSQVSILFDKSEANLINKLNGEFASISEKVQEIITDKLEAYKLKIESTFDNLETKTLEQSKYLQERIVDLNTALKSIWQEQSEDNSKYLTSLTEDLKTIIDDNAKLTSADYALLQEKISEFASNIESNSKNLTQDLKSMLDGMTKYLNSVLETQAQDNVNLHDTTCSKIEKLSSEIASDNEVILSKLEEQLEKIQVNENSLSSLAQMSANNKNLIENLEQLTKEQQETSIIRLDNIVNSVDSIITISETNSNTLVSNKEDILALLSIVQNNKTELEKLGVVFEEKFENLKKMTAEISAGELQTMDSYLANIAEQIDAQKQELQVYKNFITDFTKKELECVSKNIEKETDVIICEMVEQFDLLKKSNNDDLVNLTSQIEEIVNAHIYNNIEDLKGYLDIKTDNSVLSSKLDNLKSEMSSTIQDVISNLNKMLEASAFTSALNDFRLANEILINSSVDKLNEKIESFVSENIQNLGAIFADSQNTIAEKLALFDKKFVETLVDKYEEIKLLANKSNSSFDSIGASIESILNEFATTKGEITSRIDSLANSIIESAQITSKEIQALNASFENLRAQISSKSFDEAFQASINKQIGSLESLITEQMGYIEDINDLCATNLPDVTELNTLVKHSILESIKGFTEKFEQLDNIELTFESELKTLKTDIITQILNIFNQISFVSEQEEILDFIQDKHEELISVLSHIVTSSTDVSDIKDTLSDFDTNLVSIKDEISLINDKISAIISSEEDIDYIYSLHDLESDIANLRIVLNEIKEQHTDKEFTELINSTNEIYSLVEAIKTEFPSKADFEGIAEDIVSISSRTNKLILASDESYKTLQDNLQDFKLVINDLDERTKNFARESGIDRIDTKLNAINSMMINGSKTNQVFNQVFEYLAEWVDNASVKINTISDRVETLDDIGQIKVMLEDLKAGAEDNSDSVELIEALGTVFDKQTKRISSLEAKLDRIIVETTINNKNNKIDMTPMEDTLNRFLVAMDEKMNSQQDKINSLEEKLANVMTLLDEKDTAQLTKKMGGMDRQIAKLNKSIEKIASHVVDK